MTNASLCYASHVHGLNSSGYERRYFSVVSLRMPDNVLAFEKKGTNVSYIFRVVATLGRRCLLLWRGCSDCARKTDGRKAPQGGGDVHGRGSWLCLVPGVTQESGGEDR